MRLSISIVSHGSGHLLASLLQDLRSFPPEGEFEILLTLNRPEDEAFLAHADGLPLIVLRNVRPLGFGANHNQAFAMAHGERFVILNPDIRLEAAPWAHLQASCVDDVAACAPLVRAPTGGIEDSARRYPTIARLLRRAMLGQRSADYPVSANGASIQVDWVAGMFVMFAADAFRAIGGFDTRYHMYLEDVDICKRFNAAGRRVLWVPACEAIHAAQRASRRNWQHRRWHWRSMIRFMTGR